MRTENLPAACPGATCITGDLAFYDGGGNLHQGGAVVSISDNVVVVQYQNPPNPVADARIGLVRARALVDITGTPTPLRADTPFGGSNRTSLGSAAVAGAPGGGNTANIEPTGAALVNNGNSNQINFTFETNVAAGGASPDCFTATSSNNRRLFGDGISISGNTVTVTFDGMQEFSEMITRAGIEAPDGGAPCVQSTTGAVPNTMAGLPVGGNVGAVATGYTDAPEPLGGTKSGGNVTVPVDQRVDQSTINLGAVNLLDNQGNTISGPPSSAAVNGNGSPTDPHSVTFTFDPVAVGNAAGIQLLPGALLSFPTNPNNEMTSEPSIVQTFALTG